MTGNHFQICILDEPWSGRGYLLPPDFSEHVTISRIMIQVLYATTSLHGQAALKALATEWCSDFEPDLRAESCVTLFQLLLRTAIKDRRQWPKLILRYGLNNVDAIFSATQAARRAKVFKVQDFLITVNANVSLPCCSSPKHNSPFIRARLPNTAQRVSMYMQDISLSSNEQYVRFLEIFTNYIHEIGHMFITFLHLTFRQRCSLRDPRGTALRYGPRKPEAGFALEHHFFGGILQRNEDESGRSDENMVCTCKS